MTMNSTELAVEATKEGYELFRRDFITATVVMLVVFLLIMGAFALWMVKKQSVIYENRVDDQRVCKDESEAQAERLAGRLRDNTEVLALVRDELQQMRNRRRASDAKKDAQT